MISTDCGLSLWSAARETKQEDLPQIKGRRPQVHRHCWDCPHYPSKLSALSSTLSSQTGPRCILCPPSFSFSAAAPGPGVCCTLGATIFQGFHFQPTASIFCFGIWCLYVPFVRPFRQFLQKHDLLETSPIYIFVDLPLFSTRGGGI